MAVNSWQTFQSKSGGGGTRYCQGCPGHQLYRGAGLGAAWAAPATSPTPVRPRPLDTTTIVANPTVSRLINLGLLPRAPLRRLGRRLNLEARFMLVPFFADGMAVAVALEAFAIVDPLRHRADAFLCGRGPGSWPDLFRDLVCRPAPGLGGSAVGGPRGYSESCICPDAFLAVVVAALRRA